MTKKITVIVNPNFSVASLMNGIGHILLGIGDQVPTEDLQTTKYYDQNDQPVTYTSDYSFVILKAKTETKLKNFQQKALQSDCLTNTFYKTMFADELNVQQEKIAKDTENQTLVAVAVFGDKDAVETITKKFSVYA